jgi:hypothetical protein
LSSQTAILAQPKTATDILAQDEIVNIRQTGSDLQIRVWGGNAILLHTLN